MCRPISECQARRTMETFQPLSSNRSGNVTSVICSVTCLLWLVLQHFVCSESIWPICVELIQTKSFFLVLIVFDLLFAGTSNNKSWCYVGVWIDARVWHSIIHWPRISNNGQHTVRVIWYVSMQYSNCAGGPSVLYGRVWDIAVGPSVLEVESCCSLYVVFSALKQQQTMFQVFGITVVIIFELYMPRLPM